MFKIQINEYITVKQQNFDIFECKKNLKEKKKKEPQTNKKLAMRKGMKNKLKQTIERKRKTKQNKTKQTNRKSG